jgi:hypothetical protein
MPESAYQIQTVGPSQVPRNQLPTAGEINEGLIEGFDGPAYDAGYAEHMKKTIY